MKGRGVWSRQIWWVTETVSVDMFVLLFIWLAWLVSTDTKRIDLIRRLDGSLFILWLLALWPSLILGSCLSPRISIQASAFFYYSEVLRWEMRWEEKGERGERSTTPPDWIADRRIKHSLNFSVLIKIKSLFFFFSDLVLRSLSSAKKGTFKRVLRFTSFYF